MLTGFFTDGPVVDYASARRADTARYARYFHAMLTRGVYLAPSQFEAAFVSLAHTEADLAAAEAAAAEALAAPDVVVDLFPTLVIRCTSVFQRSRRASDCR